MNAIDGREKANIAARFLFSFQTLCTDPIPAAKEEEEGAFALWLLFHEFSFVGAAFALGFGPTTSRTPVTGLFVGLFETQR
jgi:hypothetical protein